MKKANTLLRWSVFVPVVVVLLSPVVWGENWPRKISVPQADVTMFQPQLESFSENRLTCRAAVAVLPAGFQDPVFGAVWVSVRVDTDRDSRMVHFSEVDVPEAKFPNAKQENVDKLKSLLKKEIPTWGLEISMDRLLAMLDLAVKDKKMTGDLKHTAPKIIVKTAPAVLVVLDGHAKLSKIKTPDVMRVVNTPHLMFFDMNSSTYYLKGGTRWFRGTDLPGTLAEAQVVPVPVREGVKEFENPFADPPAEIFGLAAPDVIVTEEPAELIVINGQPKYASLEGAGLLYVSNTTSDVFQHVTSQDFYILLSGRWYRAGTLGSSEWEYVKAESLPPAFDRIGPDSEKAHVLCSVAGTVQANEAVMNTYIPQTAAISRSDATLKVQYDGPPKFVSAGGVDVEYAVNTSYAVFRANGKFYCCHNAIWFVADSDSGPWQVCTSVPSSLYTIPPSCPHYPARYVYVYGWTPEVVHVGYTPGYTGCYVSDGVVVYGTGYHYSGWHRNVYYPRPCTWGYAVRYHRRTDSWGVGIAYSTWYGRRGVAFGYRNVDVDVTRDTKVFRNLYYDKSYAKRPMRADQMRQKRDDELAKTPVKQTSAQANNVYAGPKGDVYRRENEEWQVNTPDGWQTQQTRSSGAGVYETQPSTPVEQPKDYDWSNTNLQLEYQVRDRGHRRMRDYNQNRPTPLPVGGRRR